MMKYQRKKNDSNPTSLEDLIIIQHLMDKSYWNIVGAYALTTTLFILGLLCTFPDFFEKYLP